jgi:hypothetical protein
MPESESQDVSMKEVIERHAEASERFKSLISSEIVQKAVLIEAKLEVIIAFHFCDDRDKWLSFRSLIFHDGEITFSQKIRICQKLFKEHYPLIYEQVSPMFKRLDKIRELRNKLAHSKILPPEFNDPQVYMEYYKNGQIIKELVDSETNKAIIEDAAGCNYFLGLIEGDMEAQRSIGKARPIPANKINFMLARCPSLIATKYHKKSPPTTKK